MMDENNPMQRFNFLIGTWNLEYNIPESKFSKKNSDSGIGTFSKVLKDNYVVFDYKTNSGGEAKGIFAWDCKEKNYRYWWFENSGSFQMATCDFIDDNILAMNWQDTLIVQTFTQINEDTVVLKMQYPSVKGDYDLILEVILTKNK